MSRILRATDQLEDDVSKANIFVHGDEDATYTAKDGTKVRSIRNLQKEADINIGAAEQAAKEAKSEADKARELTQGSQVSSGIYASIEEGLSKTENKDVFLVLRDGGIDSYQNNSGIAVLLEKDVTSISKVLELSKSQKHTQKTYDNEYDNESLFKVIDAEGRRTWLEVDKEGLPSKTAIKGIAKRQGVSHEELPDQSDLMFAIVSKEGVVTHLALDENGRFPDFVIRDIASRIGVKKYRNDIGFVGSSSVWLMHNLIKKYFEGHELALLGDSGARFDSIAVRAGFPATIKFLSDEIKQGVNSITTSWEIDRGMDMFSVTLDNGLTGDILFSNDKYIFRSNKDSPILMNSEINFVTDIGLFDFVFINSGKNNLGSQLGVGEDIFHKTLALVKFYESQDIDYVVLDHFVNQGSSEAIKSNVLECNKLLKRRFGDKFMSIFDMIQSDEMWEFTGLNKTEEDLVALNNDELPPSFQMNKSHLNETANNYIVFKMLEKYKEMTNDTNN
ncbi:hypothetical protein GCM10007161_13600 [Ignatzschineria indica]|uniref:Uncharacterized protein n=1 Tax=Ignatzschineria indica TaxID=472583 RepID=A0A2U2AJN6_9GAMM|nr:hypothetical protein [Ignatzschineria indica]PWD83044.1 hypothetical protein DC082_06360 [Ignatzschineria indica]GGZ83362.1 hypothetical protein GCM10007161_13600 [Ignatzschineria indica]